MSRNSYTCRRAPPGKQQQTTETYVFFNPLHKADPARQSNKLKPENTRTTSNQVRPRQAPNPASTTPTKLDIPPQDSSHPPTRQASEMSHTQPVKMNPEQHHREANKNPAILHNKQTSRTSNHPRSSPCSPALRTGNTSSQHSTAPAKKDTQETSSPLTGL